MPKGKNRTSDVNRPLLLQSLLRMTHHHSMWADDLQHTCKCLSLMGDAGILGDMKALLTEMPTMRDLESLTSSLSPTLKKYIAAVRTAVTQQAQRTTALENDHSSVLSKMVEMEALNATKDSHLTHLKLQLRGPSTRLMDFNLG